jgi:hypothetical protein
MQHRSLDGVAATAAAGKLSRVRPSYAVGIRRYLQRIQAALRYDRGIIGAPSDRAKRRFLLSVFQERRHELLVESGTFQGGTVEYFVPHAKRIISVEIEPALHAAARERFSDTPSVELLLGDAMDLIPQILEEVSVPPFVYLDGHFTGGVNQQPGKAIEPAPDILAALGERPLPPGSTVIVDDLRLFGRGDWFPALDELTAAARTSFPDAEIYVGIDSLVIAT